MRVAVLGSGPVAAGLVGRWSRHRSGAHPCLVSRDPAAASARWDGLGVPVLSYAAAGAWAQALVLAVPFPAVREALARFGPVGDRVVLDATNPWGHGVAGQSGAEVIAGWVRPAPVVKAFNTVPVEALAWHGQASEEVARIVGLFCGDEAAARQIAEELIVAADLVPLDVGSLPMARLLEPLAGVLFDAAPTGASLALALARSRPGL